MKVLGLSTAGLLVPLACFAYLMKRHECKKRKDGKQWQKSRQDTRWLVRVVGGSPFPWILSWGYTKEAAQGSADAVAEVAQSPESEAWNQWRPLGPQTQWNMKSWSLKNMGYNML